MSKQSAPNWKQYSTNQCKCSNVTFNSWMLSHLQSEKCRLFASHSDTSNDKCVNMNDRERQCGEDGELSTLKSLFHSFIENIAHSSSHTFNDTEHAIAFIHYFRWRNKFDKRRNKKIISIFRLIFLMLKIWCFFLTSAPRMKCWIIYEKYKLVSCVYFTPSFNTHRMAN